MLELCSETTKKTPIPQYTTFLKMASNNVRFTLNPVNGQLISGKTKAVIGNWVKNRQLQQETKKGSSLSHLGGIPKFLHL